MYFKENPFGMKLHTLFVFDQTLSHIENGSGAIGGGSRVPPETSDREIFADVSGKKRQGKKGKG